ncbi:MAG TPA: nuclear transport factor 2 family protein [Thermoleophilaceae bacterium]|jgi:ketosteroid isomerase-like protein
MDDVAQMTAIYDAFNRRNFEELAGLMDPEVVFEEAEARGDRTRERRGRERLLEYLVSWWDAWETVHWDVYDGREEGGRVLTLCTLRGRPRGTDTEVDRRMGHITRFRDGRMLHTRSYVDVERAASDFEAGIG